MIELITKSMLQEELKKLGFVPGDAGSSMPVFVKVVSGYEDRKIRVSLPTRGLIIIEYTVASFVARCGVFFKRVQRTHRWQERLAARIKVAEEFVTHLPCCGRHAQAVMIPQHDEGGKSVFFSCSVQYCSDRVPARPGVNRLVRNHVNWNKN